MYLTIKYNEDLFTFDVEETSTMRNIYNLVQEHFHLTEDSFHISYNGEVIDCDINLNETSLCSDSVLNVELSELALFFIQNRIRKQKNSFDLTNEQRRNVVKLIINNDVSITEKIFQELIKNSSVNIDLMLHICKNDDVELLDRIIDYVNIGHIISWIEIYCDSRFGNYLHACVVSSSYNVAIKLIKRGIDISDRDALEFIKRDVHFVVREIVERVGIDHMISGKSLLQHAINNFSCETKEMLETLTKTGIK